eukprot:CAMPEP_0177540778 /NCGR_PEP_ID=MMETSP0369-20130122/59786_1 /TAXON_ID=447022 ORGANISM="Scrippsiella hangoei-like, Strain SHHI-4" /NCGR_SAMPLE_ID=MMETSP0369 /ASSEMBLY_ACC=CAM_ASM_000364 /LENGTH=132 /DNA_ID=CAMNT_0019024067 /DNA_START=204 /DNA_END=600 /DNA_ORIENTATION=+
MADASSKYSDGSWGPAPGGSKGPGWVSSSPSPGSNFVRSVLEPDAGVGVPEVGALKAGAGVDPLAREARRVRLVPAGVRILPAAVGVAPGLAKGRLRVVQLLRRQVAQIRCRERGPLVAGVELPEARLVTDA